MNGDILIKILINNVLFVIIFYLSKCKKTRNLAKIIYKTSQKIV
jgi:hypothetical protein